MFQSPVREPVDDQLSQDSESPTLDTCLDEGDTDNIICTSTTWSVSQGGVMIMTMTDVEGGNWCYHVFV